MSLLRNPLATPRGFVFALALVAGVGSLAVTPGRSPTLVTPAYADTTRVVAQAQPGTSAAAQPSPPATPAAPPADPAAAAKAGGTPVPGAAPAGAAAKRPPAKAGATIGITIDDDEAEADEGENAAAAQDEGRAGDTGSGKRHRKVTVSGFGRSGEYESLADLTRDAPWVIGIVFVSLFLVFLVPLLTIVLIIWYKMRKQRMLNETMLKLAEKGVVPPAEAMDALGASQPQAAVARGASTGALYAKARAIRAGSVWSDLRRGIMLVAVGFALQTCSMLSDGETNGLGLVLFFLGVGYIVLWYFEDRRVADAAPGSASTAAATPRDDRAP